MSKSFYGKNYYIQSIRCFLFVMYEITFDWSNNSSCLLWLCIMVRLGIALFVKMSSETCPSLSVSGRSQRVSLLFVCLMLLCESAQVITASVKSFAHCFSSPHGHHSRKSITQGNTKSQRPIYYSIAKSRKNLDKSGNFFSFAQVRVNMLTEKNTKECLM